MLLFAGVFALAADDPKKDPKKEIEGSWRAVKITASGNPVDAAFVESFRVQFERKTYVNSMGEGASEKGEYSVDDTTKPRTIDFDIKDGPDKGKKQLGIFKVEGNTLTIWVTEPGSSNRPKSFEADPGLPVIEYVLKRSNP
jgi:uncharacterized protein (TIGR03067 family)